MKADFGKRAMKSFDTSEVSARLLSLLDQVQRGEQIVITKHGKAVARLVPVGVVSSDGLADTVARLKAFRRGRRLGGSVKALIEEGRR